MKILVTGANGFVGRAVCIEAIYRGFSVQAATRISCNLPAFGDSLGVGSISGATDWGEALLGVSHVVHLAARVHVMRDATTDPLTEFRRINVEGTLNLARQAALAGVDRFIFISSIKVNGELTLPGHPFKACDIPTPQDAYAISKLEAEQGLREIAAQTGLKVVVIRPPLVYGIGVKGNFAAMMLWLQRGMPLPFGAIRNQRSLVALSNLVDLILLCLTHPSASNQIFLVSDGEDVSTAELLRRLARAVGCPIRLVPVPGILLKVMAALVGKADVARRLCESLRIDIEKTRQLLGWTPVVTMDEQLKGVVRHDQVV